MVSLGAFPVKSILARPADGERTKVGPQEIVGVAFSGEAAISRVVKRGRGRMPAFAVYKDQEIGALLAYLRQLRPS